MRKFLLFALCIVLGFSFVACASDESDSEQVVVVKQLIQCFDDGDSDTLDDICTDEFLLQAKNIVSNLDNLRASKTNYHMKGMDYLLAEDGEESATVTFVIEDNITEEAVQQKAEAKLVKVDGRWLVNMLN